MTAAQADKIIVLLSGLVIQGGITIVLLLVIAFLTGRRR